MKNKAWSGTVLGKNGWLYPMLVIAAISVIIFSAFGVATMTGLLPRAESMNEHEPRAMTKSRVAGSADRTSSAPYGPGRFVGSSGWYRSVPCIPCRPYLLPRGLLS